MSTIIKVENISKSYLISHQKQERYVALRDVISNNAKSLGRRVAHLMGRNNGQAKHSRPTKEEFWALKDISCEIKEGERVGIIGRNGAGKTTLLKILSRITEPTKGKITIDGRVASLLEVGTGFHPELTGRENIFLNGAILGLLRSEIKNKFDEIVEFAEVEKFLDTPVKRYSSGMYVRLAFAVAAHLEPEILLVDEVLAVGDMQFQKKCLGKMEEVSNKEGRTVLFVSHNMAMISSLCEKCILLDKGKNIMVDNTSNVLSYYYNDGKISHGKIDFSQNKLKIGDDNVVLLAGWIENEKGEFGIEFNINEKIKICMQYKIINKLNNVKIVPNFHLYTGEGICVFITASDIVADEVGEYVSECVVPDKLMNSGMYFIDFAATTYYSGSHVVNFWQKSILSFNVYENVNESENRHGYAGPIPGAVRPRLDWNLRKVVS
jgi:lipopolysaccharide transport system ATP-binding protein